MYYLESKLTLSASAIRFSLGVEDERADAGRTGQPRDQFLRRERKQGKFLSPVQLNASRADNHSLVHPHSAESGENTHMLTLLAAGSTWTAVQTSKVFSSGR